MIGYVDAHAEMLSMFISGWNDNAAAAAGLSYTPEIRVTGIEKTTHPDTSRYYCQFTMIEDEEFQSTHTGENGFKRYEHRGMVAIQIFGPRSDDNAAKNCQLLAPVARDVFRGITTDTGITFNRAKISGLLVEPKWIMINVNSAFRYEEQGV